MNGQGRKPVKIDLQSLAERKVHYTFMYCIIVLYAKENTLLLLLQTCNSYKNNAGEKITFKCIDQQ